MPKVASSSRTRAGSSFSNTQVSEIGFTNGCWVSGFPSTHCGHSRNASMAEDPKVKAMMVTAAPKTIESTRFRFTAAVPVRLGFGASGFDDRASEAKRVPMMIEVAIIAWMITQIQTSSVVRVVS